MAENLKGDFLETLKGFRKKPQNTEEKTERGPFSLARCFMLR